MRLIDSSRSKAPRNAYQGRKHFKSEPMNSSAGALPLLLACGLAMAQSDEPDAGDWAFAATLDGRPIGTHRFIVRGTPSSREVESRALLRVSVLGIPVYRYAVAPPALPEKDPP